MAGDIGGAERPLKGLAGLLEERDPDHCPKLRPAACEKDAERTASLPASLIKIRELPSEANPTMRPKLALFHTPSTSPWFPPTARPQFIADLPIRRTPRFCIDGAYR
jgi:hypothetical protein